MSTTPGQSGDWVSGDRRLDRRTFLRSALAGGAVVAAGGLLDAASASESGASTLRTSSAAARKRGGSLKVGLTGGGSTDTLNPFYGGISGSGRRERNSCTSRWSSWLTMHSSSTCLPTRSFQMVRHRTG